MSSRAIVKFSKFGGVEEVKRQLRDPQIAVNFFKSRESQDLFEALDMAHKKWQQNMQKFESSDKKDKYLNGYKVDDNASPIINTDLDLVKENTGKPYDVVLEEEKDELPSG